MAFRRSSVRSRLAPLKKARGDAGLFVFPDPPALRLRRPADGAGRTGAPLCGEPMGPSDLHHWNQKIRAALAELERQDFGYPIGENKVRDPLPSRVELPEALVPLYAISDGLSLPD